MMLKRTLAVVLMCLLVGSAGATIKDRVLLHVPTVSQGKSLCGPATIEMLFRYWGEDSHGQYDIAASMLSQFSYSERYRKSGILDTHPTDWDRYPGTGTINMREFLKRFGRTENVMLEYESEHLAGRAVERERMFNWVKAQVSRGIPVIVHQYWKLPKSSGHYRIVTGYDEHKRMVYLNDANRGRRVTQSYDQFLDLWNFNQRWLHYNAIAFNPGRTPLDVRL